ncbi:peptidase M75 [Mycolicibacterium sp. (ex Dasyatis americana)]|uniref:iron uptake system protein EfeO n=1 Tax=Mycobacterium sp. DBP42 TaxID=2545267 RepID=UPI0008734A51|nr:iron uptake system protein EfeO [Mycobacterium sp. DBP42]OFB39979.1 peptidase M75 [Mycolicibacterium sp. (ex Dasyatis americana)]TMS55730.1 peptidase M75 family protein [Mycobacterium sp. DBP42]
MAYGAHYATTGLTTALLLAVLTGISISGCAPKQTFDDGRPASNEITVSASDDFCQLSRTSADTGTTAFVVTNNGTLVTEFYVYAAGDRVVGAVENIAPGLQRKLIVQLAAPGKYYTACRPAMVGDGIRANFKVTGNAVPSTQSKFDAAAEDYRNYVTTQTSELVTATEAFVGTIKKGDVEGAQPLYAKARAYYERIEPVSASFPNDLGRRIDLREADLRPGEKWTGFHHLEKNLWMSKPPPDTNAIANLLVADVKELDAAFKDPKWTIDPAELIGGAQRVLDEMAANAITGQEDIFSHTDLWDFQANLDGSRIAVGSVRPIVDERRPGFGVQIDQAFATVEGVLDSHHWNDGFVYYDSVTEPERQELSQAVQALSAVVAQVRDMVAQP